MAKSGKFRWDRAGYSAVMGGAGVQGLLDGAARAIADDAESRLSAPDGYFLPGFEVKEMRGDMATGRVVRTKTDHARYSEQKNKTLTKALRAQK